MYSSRIRLLFPRFDWFLCSLVAVIYCTTVKLCKLNSFLLYFKVYKTETFMKQDACWAFTLAILGVDVWVGGGGDWFLNNVCIYDNKQWAVGVLSDLCWNLRVFCPVGSLGTCKKVLGVRWRKRGVYQQVLNLRKGVGHPFVEPQLGVGDDGVLTGNFSQKAGIAISTDFFFIL